MIDLAYKSIDAYKLEMQRFKGTKITKKIICMYIL